MDSRAELGVTMGLGVLNAPVEARCRRSNSSCSFGGRRGGAGPVANAVLLTEWVKNLLEGRRNLGGRSRDIVTVRLGDNLNIIEADVVAEMVGEE